MAKYQQGSGARDQAGVGPHLRPGMQLVPLRDVDGLRVAGGDADIRGWEVRTVSGREIGKVDDLLLDRASTEIVLLRVDLPRGGGHALAPIRAAHLDRARRVVLVDSAELRDARDLPSLAHGGELTADEVRLFGEQAPFLGSTTEERAVSDVATAPAALPPSEPPTSAPVRADGVEETVVERRPVVVEEVVVRRRVVEPDSDEAREISTRERVRDDVAPRATDDRDVLP